MVGLIAVASYAGEGERNGVEEGPRVILEKLKSSRKFSETAKNAIVIEPEDFDPQHLSVEYKDLLLLPEVVTSLKKTQSAVENTLKKGLVPITLIGSDEVASAVFSKVWDADTALVWIDSHPDLNTAETTPSGHIHGMSLALAIGRGDSRLTGVVGQSGATAKDIVLLGAGTADCDPGEIKFLEEENIFWKTPDDIRQDSAETVIQKTISHLKELGKTKVAIHFDLDVVSPEECPGVSVPALDTISFNQAQSLTYGIAKEFNLVAFNVAEYNPEFDIDGKTLDRAVELLSNLHIL